MSRNGPPTMAELCELMFDHDMRIERALHIPSMLTLPPADTEEAIEDGELDALDALLGFDEGTIHDAAKEEELGWVLKDVTGWVIEASASLHGPWSTGKLRSCASYPGMRTCRWFKADTYEDALVLAVEWVEADPPELLWDPKPAGKAE